MSSAAMEASSSEKDIVLRIDNLESFYGPIMAIRGVSLVVPEGKVVTVLGANGAGKTTLMKTISGVMDPQKGKIVYREKDITGMPPERLVRAGIVHVPEGREVFPLLSVEDNLAMGAFTRSDGAKAVSQDLDMVFNYFPILKDRRNQQAGTLSGGQQQMLAIARGLMSRPKLMLLDEPSLGLSPLLVKEILTIIRRLNREQRVTMLLVEQNAKAALDVADYGYVMDLGRIVIDGSAETLRQSKDVQEFYLGVQTDSQRGQKRWKQKKTWR